jgi:hypothetical protein
MYYYTTHFWLPSDVYLLTNKRYIVACIFYLYCLKKRKLSEIEQGSWDLTYV